MEILFYHLQRSGLNDVLPVLLMKTLQKGSKACVRCGSGAEVRNLDSFLWTFQDDGFLPHGTENDPFPEKQPVYLTTGFDNPASADILFLVAGADDSDITGYTRIVLIFNDND